MKELCRKTLERAYLFLDGEVLSDAERVEFKHHLDECSPCYERVGLQREIGALIRRIGAHPDCPDDLKSRISAFIQTV